MAATWKKLTQTAEGIAELEMNTNIEELRRKHYSWHGKSHLEGPLEWGP
jgi:hypothetical protein